MGEVKCHMQHTSRCGKYDLDFHMLHHQLTNLNDQNQNLLIL